MVAEIGGADTLMVIVWDLDSFVGAVLSVTVTVKGYEAGGGLGGVPARATAEPVEGPATHGAPEYVQVYGCVPPDPMQFPK